MPRRRAAWVLLAAAAAPAAPGRAAEPAVVPLRVAYQAPSGCPGADGFWAEVQGRTRRVRAARADERARAFALEVRAEPGGFVGTLRAEEAGARSVRGATCREVVSALALTTALTVDPEAVLGAPGAAPSEAPVRWALVGGGELLGGVLPVRLWGGSVSVAARPPGWRVALRGGARGLTDVDPAPAALARYRLVAATGEACPRLGAALAVEVCARLEAGVIAATGRGLDRPQTTAGLWLPATGVARASWTQRAGLGVEVEAAFTQPLVRPTFVRDEPRATLAQVGAGWSAAARIVWTLP